MKSRHDVSEKCMSPPDYTYGLWYYPSINRFVDEDGHVLHDFHELFDVWQLEEWKKTKDYGLYIDHQGNLCELYYLNQPEEDFYLRTILKL